MSFNFTLLVGSAISWGTNRWMDAAQQREGYEEKSLGGGMCGLIPSISGTEKENIVVIMVQFLVYIACKSKYLHYRDINKKNTNRDRLKTQNLS